MLVLALSSAAPVTWSNAGGGCGGGGDDDPPSMTPEYADQNATGTKFSEIATIAGGVAPCPTNYAQVEGCYNRVNPPAPSIRRSFVLANDASTNARPYDRADNPTAGETFILPNHRSTVDGRLVSDGSPGMAAFRPENLGYGFQGTSAGPLRGAQGGFYFSNMIDPRPGKSRIPAQWLAEIKGAPNGWDICSSDGPGSTGARACSAHLVDANEQDVLVQGECYDITPVWAWESGGYWDVRSVPLTAFVPGGKGIDAAENGEVVMFPRTAASYLGKRRDFSAFYTSACDLKYGTGWERCDWGYSRFATEAMADCSGGNNQPWCQLLDAQKSATGNYTFFTAPGQSHAWNGKSGNTPETHHALLEPATTSDGRLLIVHDYRQGVIYSYSDTPCDASKWTTFKPISMAFTDPQVNTRYGFAKFPMRRFDGSLIPAGETVPGGYPWIDRHGNNLMFPMVPNQRGGWKGIAEKTGLVWNHDTVGTVNAPGVVAVGAWTRGKLVLLDNALNATDWGSTDWEQRNDTFRLALYKDQVARFAPHGISLLSSLENQFNHIEAMNPITPRDVVWMMSAATQRNAEVAFDEYMQNRVLIAAHMNAELRADPFQETVAGNYQSVQYGPRNGFSRIANSSTSMWAWYWQFTGAPTYLQNSSTTVNLAQLQLFGGAWINPIAEGGVQGRGLYLDGYNDYIQATNVPVVRDFLLSVWVDVRNEGWAGGGVSRKLFEFASGSSIELSTQRLTFRTATGVKTMDVAVPAGVYTHIGVAIAGDSSRNATVFINGTKVGEVALEGISSSFVLGPSGSATSTLVIGSSGSGALPLGAWIDEFRLLRLDGSASALDFMEEVCNQALGSLKRVAGQPVCDQIRFRQSDVLDAAGTDRGLEYPLAAYTTRNCGSTVHGNADAACMRAEALGIDQKHLVANAPRPDFSAVPFCKTCHNSATNPISGMLPAALTAGSVASKLDARRQPMQWPRTMTGYAPSVQGVAIAPYNAVGGSGSATRLLDELFLGATATSPARKLGPPVLP